MTGVAFYAPLKAPTHPKPSGDRTMARAILHALADMAPGWRVDLVSDLRSHDGVGDAGVQAGLIAAARSEVARLLAAPRDWRVWVTYHNYYKSPDLIGPAVCRALGIPYVLIESTRAAKRLNGPWARFAALSEAACDRADVIFHLTDHDLPALAAGRPAHQHILRLRPFLDRAALDPAPDRSSDGAGLLAVGMMRHGDKMLSYAALARALALVTAPGWRLCIAGDGPARAEVARLFARFGAAVTFSGQLDSAALMAAYRAADLFVWPGVNEAYGMVYLEAQATGLPVLAEDRPGVRDVVRDGGLLTPQDDPAAFAAGIDKLLTAPGRRQRLGALGWQQVGRDHLRPVATQALWDGIGRVTGGKA